MARYSLPLSEAFHGFSKRAISIVAFTSETKIRLAPIYECETLPNNENGCLEIFIKSVQLFPFFLISFFFILSMLSETSL